MDEEYMHFLLAHEVLSLPFLITIYLNFTSSFQLTFHAASPFDPLQTEAIFLP